MTMHPNTIASFGDDINVAVIGGNGGIGREFLTQLSECSNVSKVFNFSRKPLDVSNTKQSSFFLDLEEEQSIEAASRFAYDSVHQLSLVIVATGLLHDGTHTQPERSWKELSADTLKRAFSINAIGPLLVAKHFLPLLNKQNKSVFAALSARVGSIGDNRLGGWYAYRSSKAALNMLIKSLSIELSRQNQCGICIGLHPGTVDTKLSKPFQRNVPPNNLKSPSNCVSELLGVLSAVDRKDTGCLLAWDGSKIPF